MDGTETAGSPVVFVAWDEWSGLVLDARVIPSEDHVKLAEFFRYLEATFGLPQGLCSDMGSGILKAAGLVWEGLPHQLCHYHFVKNLGKNLFERLEAEVRARIVASDVLVDLDQLVPGAPGDFSGSGRRGAKELEGWLAKAEPRWLRIFQDHVLGPRERASRLYFRLTYGEIAQRVWSVGEMVHELMMWNVEHGVHLVSLVKAERLTRKLLENRELGVLAHRLTTLWGWFEEFRVALGVGRDPTGSDSESVMVASEKGRRKVEAFLERIEGVAEAIEDDGLRQGVRLMRERWEKRKAHLYVEVRDTKGRVREIERTNWRSEQGHRWVRQATRGRERKGRTEEEMTRYGALIAVVSNWERPGYARAMGWEGLDIVRTMGTVSEGELAEARKLKGETRHHRSDVTRDRHREPMLRELMDILRRGGSGTVAALQGWMARRAPASQPAG